jgi:hypothetical protein
MCNKVLRNAPARQTTYLKLAKLYGAKGFLAEAKQNFVEYAERMQRVGKIEHAFAALKEFTDISPESASLREMLAEHLKMYGADPGKRTSSAGGPAGRRGRGGLIRRRASSLRANTSRSRASRRRRASCSSTWTSPARGRVQRPRLRRRPRHRHRHRLLPWRSR